MQPSFAIDISKHMSKKMEAVLCYATQFHSPNPDLNEEPQTYISSPQFLETVKARAMMLGKRIGVEYAEGFISEKLIGLSSFDAIIKNVT